MHLILVGGLCRYGAALPQLGAASSGAHAAGLSDLAGRTLKGRFLHITGMYLVTFTVYRAMMITDRVQMSTQTLTTKSTRRQRRKRLAIEARDRQASLVPKLQIATVPSAS